MALDEIDVYDQKPHQLANDRYDEIKASIRASGMDQTLTITRRPGARYMIAAGGNTRLQAVKALWRKTGDKRSLHPLPVPPLAGRHRHAGRPPQGKHARGDLSFIDRACGLTGLKALVEAEREQLMSPREFSAYLAEQRYGVSHTVLNPAACAVQSAEASTPVVLAAGMSRTQIDRIRKLHKAFVSARSAPQVPDAAIAHGEIGRILAATQALRAGAGCVQ